jgi:hypothetical protein
MSLFHTVLSYRIGNNPICVCVRYYYFGWDCFDLGFVDRMNESNRIESNQSKFLFWAIGRYGTSYIMGSVTLIISINQSYLVCMI